MAKINNKTFLVLGMLFILLAFGCALGVAYQMFDDQQQRTEEVKAIQKKFITADQEKMAAEREAQELAKRAGKEIELQGLVEAAKQEYGEEEKERKEGDLWIDRNGGNWLVTLGLLNGVEKGSRLNVMDGLTKVGVVSVETALDVVSYVHPEDDKGQYQEDFYRVVVE